MRKVNLVTFALALCFRGVNWPNYTLKHFPTDLTDDTV